MTTNFDSIQTLKSSEVCNKFSKSVSYETLVGGTTTGTEIKQTRRLFLSSAIKPLSAVGTLTSLLCNSAKVKEKLLYHHSERSEGSIMNNIKYWILRFANASLRMTMKRMLRMTIPALAFLLSLNLSESWAVTCNFTPDPNNEGKYSLEVKGDSGGNVFSGCDNGFPDGISGWSQAKSKITSATLDKNITSIGGSAFRDASSLTSITIPKGVTSIGDSAFWGAGLTSITIPDSVTSIGWAAFAFASSLTSITIPEGVKSIGDDAFHGASSLTSITIPEGVTRIGYGAFYGASSLTSITIPEGVTSIGDRAFWGTSSLTSITIPEGVTSIGDRAFLGASSLKSITIPDSVTRIEDGAFYGASSLTSITIPEGVTSIGDGAFAGASSLKSITIPDNIDTAGWSDSALKYLPANIDIVCQGGLNTCYEKLAKYFTNANCPQNLINAGKGDLCNCSSHCISPTLVSEATQNQCGGKYTWDETSNPKCRHMTENECANSAKYYINNGQCKSMPGSKTKCKNADFLWSGSSCVKSCASGFVEWDKECLGEYPFAKKRWTPAEANEWLHDGNDNFVVITFKK